MSYLLIICILLSFSITPAFAASSNPFDSFLDNMQKIKDNISDAVRNLTNKFGDMQNHWSVEWVANLEGLGIISGYGDGTFRPNANITVAEFTALVLKAKGVSIPKTQPWYEGIIYAAMDEKIILRGEFNNYDKQLISRGEMARMVVRAMGESPASGSTKFKDDSKMPSTIKGFVKTATEYGIINGYPDGTFRHDGNATRAEASTIIAKMIQNAGGKPQQPVVKDEIPEPVFGQYSTEYVTSLGIKNYQDYDESFKFKTENLSYPEFDKVTLQFVGHSEPSVINFSLVQEYGDWKVQNNMFSLTSMHNGKSRNLISPKKQIPVGTTIRYKVIITKGDKEKVFYPSIKMEQ